MKIKFLIRKESNKKDFESTANIYVRIYHGKDLDQCTKTNLIINPNFWDAKRESVKTISAPESVWKTLNAEIYKLRAFLEERYSANKESTNDSDWLKKTLDLYYNHTDDIVVELSLFDVFEQFLKVQEFSVIRSRNYRVLKRSLQRFELYKQASKNNNSYTLRLKDITSNTIQEIKDFLRDEYLYYEKYPDIFIGVPESRTPKKRGKNTIIDKLKRLHAFLEWCLKNGFINKQPFENIEIGSCNYGRPIYITLQERNQIMNFDLSLRPQLEIQRDIFIFQTLIGCRVSDLYRLTQKNINEEAIEYIPHKTKDGYPVTVHVPLNKHAIALLEKYKSDSRETLFPFISVQKYNDAIKEVFKVCGIGRMVVLLDPQTGEEVQKPIYEVASSHMARRTFIGNLYKQVKDPNLISSLSGHREGSVAFARYRDIDNEIKKELINLLD